MSVFTEEERQELGEISAQAFLAKGPSPAGKIVSKMTNELCAGAFGAKTGKNFPGGHGAYATFMTGVAKDLMPVVKRVLAKAKEVGG